MPIRFSRFLFVLIFCLVGVSAHGQKIATFQKIYRNSSDNDIFSSGLVSLPKGGFIISGIAEFVSTQVQTITFSVHLLRVDSLGKMIWSKTYKRPATDNIAFIYPLEQYVDLTLAPDGNVVVGTSTLTYPGGSLDPGYLFKIDLNGNVLWSKVYRGTSNSASSYSKTAVNTLVNDPQGGYLLGGIVTSADLTTGLYPLAMVIKTNASGSVTWAKGFSIPSSYGGICSIVPSRDGGIILGGRFHNNYCQIIKTDNKGNPKWNKGFYSNLVGFGGLLNTVIELPDKSIYVFNSRTDSRLPYSFTGNIQKLDSSGVLLWSKQYDFGLTDYTVNPAYHNGSSNSLEYNGLFGYAYYDSTDKKITVSLKNIGNGIGMMRIDSSGKIVFSKIYNNVYNYQYYYNPSHWFSRLPSDGFALLGATNTLDSSYMNTSDFHNGGNEYFLVKADKNGNTGGCNTRSVVPKVSNFPVYNYNTNLHIGIVSLSLTSDSFYSVTNSNYGMADSVVCSPFVANFGADSVCFGITTPFHDSTYFSPITWYWDFGDSTYSTLQNPTHQYKYPGTYYAKLVVSNGTMTDSITKKIKVYPLPASQLLAVSKISTSTTNGSVIIRWVTISKRNLAYNELFFSRDGKNFSSIGGKLPPSVDSFVQSGLDTKDSDYEYYLVTFDSCNAQSVQSPTHKTMTLTVKVGQLTHQLNWMPYVGFKVESYKVERFEDGGFVTIDSVPGNDTASREFPAPCNYAIYYRIAAVGYDSGQLAWSDTAGRQALDTVPPNAAKITSLSVLSANNVQLNFISSDSPDVYKYVIERAVNGNWGSGSDFITHLRGTASSYIDTVNTTTNSLCYTVITFDSCLNIAESDTICAESLSGNALNCKAEVTLALPKTTSPPTAPDSFVVYRSTDNVNYNKISELPVTATTDVDANVTIGLSYYYKLETVYSKDGMISYSDTLRMVPKTIPEADSAQLIYATIIKSDETKGAILVQWKRALLNDTNARGYYVYSYNPTNGKYALIKTITDLNDTSYVQDNINTIQNIYKYYIITYNVCDVGINSNIHKTVLLKVQNNNLNEQLNWTNYLGVPVKSYSVYKSEDGGPQNLLENAGIDSAYSDSDIACNHNFTYQIQAILANGEISFSDSITVKSFDTIRPKTEPIVLATVVRTGLKDGRIELDWLGALDKNLEGYNIYRSSDGIGWILIAQGYPGLSLIDTGLDTYDQSYYYKIQPVDSCGNLGPYTTYHETIHLKASANNGYNQLYWNGYAGWIVKQYLVYKNGSLAATLANNVFAFKDTAVICQNVYQYLIKAIDSVNDTIVSASNTDSARAQNHNPPKAVYIKTVSVSSPNKAVTISWSPSTSYDIKDYVIYRKAAIDGSMKFVDSTSLTTYIDSSETVTEPDCYYVFARDHCGNLSNGSNQGCIIILNAKASTASTGSATGQATNQLTWNSYQYWPDGVQSYNVYKQEDSSGWQLIGTVSSVQTNAFEDKNLGDSTISFCYQVEAIENPGLYNQLSRSTIECVHQDATVFIPNSFTPYNADGVNDLFGPKGLYIKDYDMKIYNRWGELVYASPQPSPEGEGVGWDGTYKGQPVQQGVYIYLITVEDYNGKKSYFKGTITMFE